MRNLRGPPTGRPKAGPWDPNLENMVSKSGDAVPIVSLAPS